jgi:hypothetical protein
MAQYTCRKDVDLEPSAGHFLDALGGRDRRNRHRERRRLVVGELVAELGRAGRVTQDADRRERSRAGC